MKIHCICLEEKSLAKEKTNASNEMCLSISFEGMELDNSVCSFGIDSAGLFTNLMLHCSRF